MMFTGVTLSKQMVCLPEKSFSGNNMMGPLDIQEEKYSFLSKKQYVDFQRKQYKEGESGKLLKITSLTRIGDEIGGTVNRGKIKEGKPESLFQIHYNTLNKRLLKTTNMLLEIDKDIISIGIDTYLCK